MDSNLHPALNDPFMRERVRNIHGAFQGQHLVYSVIPDTNLSYDLERSVRDVYPVLFALLKANFEGLPNNFALKFQLCFRVLMDKPDPLTLQIVTVEHFFSSFMEPLMTIHDLTMRLQIALRKCIATYDSFVKLGSGWSIRIVDSVDLFIHKHRLYQGGCLRKRLPNALKKSRSVLACHTTKDEQCFLYSLSLALSSSFKPHNPSRLTSTDFKIMEMLPPISGPITISDLIKYEEQLPISINLYGYDSGLVPYYVSQFSNQRKLHADLLLHHGHFFAITNLAVLVRDSSGRKNTRAGYVCRTCLAYFVTQNAFDKHKGLCSGTTQPLRMPSESEKWMTFRNYQKTLPAPFVIYADLESAIANPEKARPGLKLRETRQHECVAWSCITVCRDEPMFSSSEPVIYVGEDSIDCLFDYLDEECNRIYDILERVNVPIKWTKSARRHFEAQEVCNMCHSVFTDDQELLIHLKVRDHSHLSGEYRQALCSRCNVTYAAQRNNPKIVVFFHGLANYDSHFLVQKLDRFKTKDMWVVPRTSEKYSIFSAGSLIFKDSYQFLSSSLEQLVNNLRTKGEGQFMHVRKFFPKEEQRRLLYRKGVFPYNYVTSLQVLKQTTNLPAKEEFYNDMTKSHITDEEYSFAQKVWNEFGCQTLEDYLRVYLLTDVLTLADCFEAHRTNCLQNYDLDPVHYFSNAHYTLDAFLRKSESTIELLTDLNLYLYFSRGIRGGLSCVSHRLAIANNSQIPETFDPEKPQTHILYLDCNNLYGYSMMNAMPVGQFEFIDEITEELLHDVLSTSSDAEFGYVIECDLEYPAQLHDDHADYPLAPDRKSVPYDQLSPFAQTICDKHHLKSSTNTEKLMATLEPRFNYICHYRNLQFYIAHGLLITKVHNIVKFKQAPILKSYIEFNSQKRAEAVNDFDVNFYKFLSNSLFGKMLERADKRSIVKLVSDLKSFDKNVAKLTFKGAKIISPNLMSLDMKKSSILVDRPIFVGFSILEMAKLRMFEFHYDTMKKYFGPRIRLLYTDTDSLIYQITSPDITRDLRQLPPEDFDFSNYPKDHQLFNADRKRLPGAFKDESKGQAISHFVGLRSKMYCLKRNGITDKYAKGVKKSVIENDLKFEHYQRALDNLESFQHDFHRIQSKAHQVSTAHQEKISISPFDDKRFLKDAYNSVPYGHYSISSCGEALSPHDHHSTLTGAPGVEQQNGEQL